MHIFKLHLSDAGDFLRFGETITSSTVLRKNKQPEVKRHLILSWVMYLNLQNCVILPHYNKHLTQLYSEMG